MATFSMKPLTRKAPVTPPADPEDNAATPEVETPEATQEATQEATPEVKTPSPEAPQQAKGRALTRSKAPAKPTAEATPPAVKPEPVTGGRVLKRTSSAVPKVIDVETVPEPREPAAPAPKARPQTMAIARPSKAHEVGGFRDEADDVDGSDIVLPRINIVQKVGDLSQAFEAGTLVLGQKLQLTNPCRILIIGRRSKQYVERVPGGQPGRILNDIADVAAAGGTLDYNEAQEREIPLFQTMITWMVLVQAPGDVTEEEALMFPFEFTDGTRYALALWSTKGTAYTHAAKHLLTARNNGLFKGRFVPALKASYVNQFFLLGAEMKRYERNYAAIPTLELDVETSDEFKLWMATTLRGTGSAAQVAED